MIAPDTTAAAELETIIDELRLGTDGSRCTLRLDIPGDYAFPVVCESLAPGVESLMDFRTVGQVEGPTFRRILREREMVVQNDCRAAASGGDSEFSEDYFRELIDMYGGMAAFIATPVWLDGKLEGVISLHQLGHAREWTAGEIALAAAAGESVRAVLRRVNGHNSKGGET